MDGAIGRDQPSIVLNNFVFDVVIIVEVKPPAGFIIGVIAGFETMGDHGRFGGVDVFHHHSDVIEAADLRVSVGLGVKTSAVYRITEAGNLSLTENTLDLAINGKGYFQVTMPSGETGYTRAGSFQLDDSGNMVTVDGYALEPAITIPSGAVDITINENSDLYSKHQLLNTAIQQVERNFALIDLLQKDKDIINFSKIFNIEISNVEKIYTTSVSYKEDLEKLKELELISKKEISTLKSISKTFSNSKLFNNFSEYIPLENISETVKFKAFQTKLEDTLQQANKENQFNNSKSYIKKVLPKTIPFLLETSVERIKKENFEFAHANHYFLENKIIDLQKTKEKLSQINDRVYEQKSEILFDLAKNNFKNNFGTNEIDRFINLLESYKTNLYQGNRGIRDKIKFQHLARKNSAEISNKLSCWVMKFNDVLNSVGTEPEIFDCIIVDEASQLDFNSLILGYYAKNMIIVGDDKQTSPSALTGANDNDFQSIKNKYLEFLGDDRVQIRSDNSLFTLSKMVAGSSNLALKEHFRCVSEIIEFSKYNFYDNSLKPLKQINTENRLEPVKAVFVQNSFLEDRIVYNEIESIKKHLIEIIKNPIYQNKTIGVVSLGLVKHTEKLKDIKEDLSELFGRDKLDKIKLIIEDSPKFQGDERDVMLVSLGVALDSEKLRSNDNPKPRSIVDDGNLKDDFKKINVALSRAKEQMILFHSVKSEDLRNNDFRLKILSFFYNETNEVKPFELPNNENERNLYNITENHDSKSLVLQNLEKQGSGLNPKAKVKSVSVLKKQTINLDFNIDTTSINAIKRRLLRLNNEFEKKIHF